MRRMTIAMLLLLIAVSGALAQEQPTLLRYKFVPGQTTTYNMRGTGSLPVTLDPGPDAAFPAMGFDVTLDLAMTTQHNCTAVLPDGSGVLEMTIPLLTIRTTVQLGDQPMNTVLTWEKGALSNTINGEVQPEDNNARKLAQALASTMRLTMAPTGEQTPDAETVKLMNDLYNASAFSGLDLSRLSALTSRLPQAPVVPGATWEVKDDVHNGQATMSGQSSFTFTAWEDLAGKRTARIEGRATMSMTGQMPGTGALGTGFSYNMTKLEVNIAFVNHFDPAAGIVPVAQNNLVQNMAMTITMGGMAGAQPLHIPTVIDNGQMSMEVRTQ